MPKIEEIKSALCDRALEFAKHLFPEGRQIGKEWYVGDVRGSDGDSLKIVISGSKKGTWKDFATGDGGSLIDLYMLAKGLADFLVAAKQCEEWLAHTPAIEKEHENPGSPRPHRRPAMHTGNGNGAASGTALTFDWVQCVKAMSNSHVEKLCEARGYSQTLGIGLRANRLIGIFQDKGKKYIAFPVCDPGGPVVGVHYKIKDGRWFYTKGVRARPLILGDISDAAEVWVFESQWDALAIIDTVYDGELDRLGRERIAVLITRGAANGKVVKDYVVKGMTVILFPQNDEPDENGKIPSEVWLQTIVADLPGFRTRRVETPRHHKDANDWVRSDRPSADQVRKVIAAATDARPKKLVLWEDASKMLGENKPPKPPELIRGVLHVGSKLVFGGTSKGRKTYSLLDLAISVATGSAWLGNQCQQGRVVYLNYELQEAFIFERIELICNKKGVTLNREMLMVANLRGKAASIEKMTPDIIADLAGENIVLIIFDPIYKGLGDRDENKAGDVASLCNELEKIAVQTGAAIAFGAHFSKGNQAGKESIDRIGGSGVFARDPDAILTLTAHEQNDCYTVDATLRNLAPVEAFVIRWEYPLFYREPDLDPAALRQPAKKPHNAGEALEKAKETLLPLIEEKGLSYNEWLKASKLNQATFNKYRNLLRNACLVAKDEEGGKWNLC